jgi:hypothetical protein
MCSQAFAWGVWGKQDNFIQAKKPPAEIKTKVISTTRELRMQLTIPLHRKQFYVTKFLKSSHNWRFFVTMYSM